MVSSISRPLPAGIYFFFCTPGGNRSEVRVRSRQRWFFSTRIRLNTCYTTLLYLRGTSNPTVHLYCQVVKESQLFSPPNWTSVSVGKYQFPNMSSSLLCSNWHQSFWVSVCFSGKKSHISSIKNHHLNAFKKIFMDEAGTCFYFWSFMYRTYI